MTEQVLKDIAYVERQRAALDAAWRKEAQETLDALRERCGGTLPERLDWTQEHVRLLVRSAFIAGALYECERRAKLEEAT